MARAVPREWGGPVDSGLWDALESLDEPKLAIATRLCALAVELVARGVNVTDISGDAGSLCLTVVSPEGRQRAGGEPDRVLAAEMVRTRIRAERKARYWSVRAMAERLRMAADAPGMMPHIQSLVRMIRQWEAGTRKPGEQYRLLYCKVFGMTEDELCAVRAGS
jgi:hypothetical protein